MPTLRAPLYPVAPPLYVPPLHGLLATAVQVPDEPGSRWELGFEVEPEGWATVEAVPGVWCGSDLEHDAGVKIAEGPPGLVVYHPYQLVASYSCKIGRTGQERRDKARRFLDLGTGKAMERELWTGAMSDVSGTGNMRLAVAGTGGSGELTGDDLEVVKNPGYVPGAALSTVQPLSVEGGLEVLSQALADYGSGQKGMIHMTAAAGEAVAGLRLVEDGRGGNSVLRTKSRGDLVVVGAGYPGTGPDGAVPNLGQTWMHATSIVQYRLTDIADLPATDAEAVNRATGVWTVRAERTAAAYFDGLFLASVLVDLTLSDDPGWT